MSRLKTSGVGGQLRRNSPPTKRPRGWSPPALATPRARVACIDDEGSVLEALRRCLRNEPYDLLVTREPRRLFEWMAQGEVDLVISDQFMPGLSGLELLGQVEALCPAAARVILTGHPETPLIRERACRRIQRLLTKPWDPEGLRRTIRGVLRERAQANPGARDSDFADSQEVVARVETAGRPVEEVLGEVRSWIGHPQTKRRGLALLLEGLREAPAPRALLEGLRGLEPAKVPVWVVDPTGLCGTFLGATRDPLRAIPVHPEPRKVLLAQGRAESTHFLSALLTSAGAEIVLADGDSAALRHLRSGKFDLLLLDLALPGFGARAVAQAAVAREVEVVGLSGYDTLWDGDLQLHCGLRCCIQKPYSIPDMLAAVYPPAAEPPGGVGG